MTKRTLQKNPVSVYPAKVPERMPIGGQGVDLEPATASHIDSLFELSHSDSAHHTMWDFLPYGPFDDRDAFSAWYRDHTAGEDPMLFAFRCRQSKRAFGLGAFMRVTPDARCIEIGHIWVCPQYQNSREATEALFMMMQHCMDTLGNRRLEWKCDAMNAASRSAAARLGFTYEGIFYRATIVKGRNRDTAWFSIIDEEWPALRDAFGVWLAQSNFDANGQQHRSLSALTRDALAGVGS